MDRLSKGYSKLYRLRINWCGSNSKSCTDCQMLFSVLKTFDQLTRLELGLLYRASKCKKTHFVFVLIFCLLINWPAIKKLDQLKKHISTFCTNYLKKNLTNWKNCIMTFWNFLTVYSPIRKLILFVNNFFFLLTSRYLALIFWRKV